MNSIFNEQPNRKITGEFIEKAVNDAGGSYGVSFLPLHFGEILMSGLSHIRSVLEIGVKLWMFIYFLLFCLGKLNQN